MLTAAFALVLLAPAASSPIGVAGTAPRDLNGAAVFSGLVAGLSNRIGAVAIVAAQSPSPPACHPDPGVSYTGANLFGDRTATNTTATAEECCALCQRYAGHGCAFYQFSPASCYGHSGGCCRLKTADAWKGRAVTAGETGGSIGPLPPPPPPDLNGTVVFAAGLAGVSNYRIPAIVQTTGSTPALVAFAEARDGGDSSASRIAVRTSVDAGATWSAVTFAAGSLNSSKSRAACATGDRSWREMTMSASYGCGTVTTVLCLVPCNLSSDGHVAHPLLALLPQTTSRTAALGTLPRCMTPSPG